MWREYMQMEEPYHGTSIKRLRGICVNGLAEGLNTTGGLKGVYCEGSHRRGGVFNYVSHERIGESQFLVGIILEFLVDRQFGRSIHRQLAQPSWSVIPTGFLIHVINIHDCYQPSCLAGSQSIRIR